MNIELSLAVYVLPAAGKTKLKRDVLCGSCNEAL